MKICLKSFSVLIFLSFIFVNQCDALKWRLKNGQTVSPDVVIKTSNSLETLSKQNYNLLQNFIDYCCRGTFNKGLSIEDFRTLKELGLLGKNGEISYKVCSVVSAIIFRPIISRGKIIELNVSCPLDMSRFKDKRSWIGLIADTALSTVVSKLVEYGMDFLWDVIKKSYNNRHRLKRKTVEIIEQNNFKFDSVFDENGKVKKEISDILLDFIQL